MSGIGSLFHGLFRTPQPTVAVYKAPEITDTRHSRPSRWRLNTSRAASCKIKNSGIANNKSKNKQHCKKQETKKTPTKSSLKSKP